MNVNGLDKQLVSVLITIVILVGFYLLALLLRKLVGAAVARTSTEGHIDDLLGSMVYYMTLLAGLVTALSRFVQVGAVVASLGLTSVAIGFAVKDVLGNFLAGLMILAQRPFIVGDNIEVAGVSGEVHAIRVRDTLLKTADGKLLLIPSSVVFNNIVTNNSVFSRKRQTVHLTLGAEPGAARLAELTEGVLAQLEKRYGMRDTQVIFGTVGPNGLELEIRFFIDVDKTKPDEAKSALVTSLVEAIRGASGESGTSGKGSDARGD